MLTAFQIWVDLQCAQLFDVPFGFDPALVRDCRQWRIQLRFERGHFFHSMSRLAITAKTASLPTTNMD